MKALAGVRRFQIPALRWDCKQLSDIIDWNSKAAIIHEPSILKKLDKDELRKAITQPIIMPKFPLHSQTVERGVKLVPEASCKVIGEERRHQHILTMLTSRQIRAACDTKSDFKYKKV